jgi:hypothetical protein
MMGLELTNQHARRAVVVLILAITTGATGEVPKPSAEIFLMDLLSSDMRTFTAEDVMRRCDVHLEVRNRELAERFRSALRDGITCDKTASAGPSEYIAVVTFNATNGFSDVYLISTQLVESSDFKCHRKMDRGLRKMLFGLLLTNDPTSRFPELLQPGSRPPQ